MILPLSCTRNPVKKRRIILPAGHPSLEIGEVDEMDVIAVELYYFNWIRGKIYHIFPIEFQRT